MPGRQRVELGAPKRTQQKVSRPLRTGTGFVLVVPAARIVAGHWDKVAYRPGDQCRLTVVGAGLGEGPLSLTVDAGQKEAVAEWRFPPAPVLPGAATVREAEGSLLSDAQFEDRRDLQEGGTAWLLARAEGRCLQVVLEREGNTGQVGGVGQAVATVKSGALRAAVTPEAEQKAPAR
jgi:hypothetical protein